MKESHDPKMDDVGFGRHLIPAATGLILVLAALLYFSFLGHYPLLDPDEGRYAEIPREMIESGDFITPHLNYVKYFEKPPLFYWLTAGAIRLFGPSEWAVRSVPAMAGFMTVLLVMGLGRRFFNPRAGVMAGWIYLTSLVPFALARLPIIDGVFSLLLTATWGAWWMGYTSAGDRGKRGWYGAAWGFMGLAVMTKGIAAIALTGLIVLGFVALRKEWGELRRMAWLPGLILFAIIVLPWHIAVGLRNPEFWHFYVVDQHFSRLISPEHAKPFWFFVVVFPLGMLFWSALLFPGLWNAARRAVGAVRLFNPRPPRKGEQHEGTLFLMVWIGAVVGLFSLSSCKLVPYILPAYPAAALLLGAYLSKGEAGKAAYGWCAGITAIGLVLLIPVVSYYARHQEMLPVASLDWAVRAAQAGLLVGALFLGGAALRRRLIPAATGLVLILLIPAMVLTVPVVARYRKTGAFMKAMPRPLPEQIRIADWRAFDQSLSFYGQRRIILVDEIDELAFGRSLGDHKAFFRQGAQSLRQLAESGPLLINIRPEDWPQVRGWGILKPVAANSTNVMVGNDPFFRLTGLRPWPDTAVGPPPLLLMPRRAESIRQTGS